MGSHVETNMLDFNLSYSFKSVLSLGVFSCECKLSYFLSSCINLVATLKWYSIEVSIKSFVVPDFLCYLPCKYPSCNSLFLAFIHTLV